MNRERAEDEAQRELEVDLERGREAYAACDGDTAALDAIFSHNFFRPIRQELEAKQGEIDSFLQSGQLRVVVPMREPKGKADEVEGVLCKLARQLPPGKVLAVDNGSAAEVIATARGIPGVRLLSRNDVFERLLDMPRLLSLMNPPGGIRPERGKGLTVLAGYLCSYFLDEVEGRAKWLGQCDAEIAGFEDKETDEGIQPGYRCLEHLGWGMLAAPQGRYFKMAMPGRGNDRCAHKRRDLLKMSKWPCFTAAVRQRMREIGLRLGPHLWMLTGEFVLHRDLAFQRPFATGYLEETLISMFVEDLGAQGHPGRNGYTVQVYNRGKRSDAQNPDKKEGLMQTQICDFLDAMAQLVAGSVNTWRTQDIVALNRGYMAAQKEPGVFPNKEEEKMDIESYEDDRIIPSVTALIEEGFVNVEAGRQFAGELLEQERCSFV